MNKLAAWDEFRELVLTSGTPYTVPPDETNTIFLIFLFTTSCNNLKVEIKFDSTSYTGLSFEDAGKVELTKWYI